MTRLRLALFAAAALGAALPAAAGAQNATFGSAKLTLDGPAYKTLRAKAVSPRVSAGARLAGRSVTLPVRAGRVAGQAAIDLRGTLTLRAGRRSVRLSAVQLQLSRAQTIVRARIGAKSLIALTSTRRAALDARAQTARLTGARLVLTRTAARLVTRALRLPTLSQRTIGTLTLRATVASAPAPAATPTTTNTPTGGQTPTTGTPGTATPLPAEPARLARPATAVPIVDASVNWHVRDSFIQYIASGGGGGTAGAGATAGAPTVRQGSEIPLVYDFAFSPAATGWYDPPSGRAAVYFTGTVRFLFPGRFDFTASDPELEINAGSSRAIFRFNGQGATTFDNRRGVLVDLQPVPAPSVSPDGRTRTYAALPGVIPPGAASSIFADFYVPGDAFGSFALSFTTA